jgi:glucuronoarabinoxylan endo-1,4-beta-xylanase
MPAGRDHSENADSQPLRRRTLLAAGAALPVLAVGTPAAAATSVVVEPSNVQQTILGFGGMNHTVWINDLTTAQRETAFGNGAGQLG